MKVVLSAEAKHDLEHIGDHIAQDDPRRAETFVAEIESKCLGLSRTPNAYPVVSRYRDRGLRKRTHGRYLILYEVGTDEIRIVRVVHGARNWNTLLDGPGSQ